MIHKFISPMTSFSTTIFLPFFKASTGSGLNPENITFHFPLLNEDPFVNERAARMLEDVVTAPHQPSSSKSVLEGGAVLAREGEATSRQQIEALFSLDPALLPTSHMKVGGE